MCESPGGVSTGATAGLVTRLARPLARQSMSSRAWWLGVLTALIPCGWLHAFALVAAATTDGKNICPRVAAMLDVMQVSEITAVKGADTFERPIYAGNAIQTVQATDGKKVITVRTANFASAGEKQPR